MSVRIFLNPYLAVIQVIIHCSILLLAPARAQYAYPALGQNVSAPRDNQIGSLDEIYRYCSRIYDRNEAIRSCVKSEQSKQLTRIKAAVPKSDFTKCKEDLEDSKWVEKSKANPQANPDDLSLTYAERQEVMLFCSKLNLSK